MFYLAKLVKANKPEQSYIFETLKLDAGSHTWAEKMRVMEEQLLFHDRELVITTEGTGFPGLAKTYIR